MMAMLYTRQLWLARTAGRGCLFSFNQRLAGYGRHPRATLEKTVRLIEMASSIHGGRNIGECSRFVSEDARAGLEKRCF
jgi:hypothetical protein